MKTGMYSNVETVRSEGLRRGMSPDVIDDFVAGFLVWEKKWEKGKAGKNSSQFTSDR